MEKELKSWRSEAALWQSRLAEKQQRSSAARTVQQECSTLDGDIAKEQTRILALRRQVLVNEASLSEMIRAVVNVT